MTLTIWLCVTGWVLGWVALGRPRRLGRTVSAPGAADHHFVADERPPATTVSILIPARDEEPSIGRLLSDLTTPAPGTPAAISSSFDTQIVVVDDHSTDSTAQIAAACTGVRVVDAPPLPSGWTGKNWACQTAVEQSSVAGHDSPEELLVFIDADVRLQPNALELLVEEHRRHGGLVSVQPWHETERAYEQLSALFNVIALMGIGAGGSNPTGAFGPVLATSRADYERAGGHRSVHDQVVEDLALAQRFRAADTPITVLAGGDRIRFRMYPSGVRQVIEGWTKNFALGASSTPMLRLAAIVVWVTALGSAAMAGVDALQGQISPVVGGCLYALFVVQLALMFRLVGRFGVVTALLYPVLLAFFLLVFVRSIWLTHVRRSVSWRGRAIATHTKRA